MATVYIGIGSNIGDRQINCEKAIDIFGGSEDFKVVSVSSFYETKPLGGPPQDDFINGTFKIETELSPEKCLSFCKATEESMGRKPSGKNFPRIIDLDILLYDGQVIESERLKVPHPLMQEREFVLKGMYQIAPELMHPVLMRTMEELYASLKN